MIPALPAAPPAPPAEALVTMRPAADPSVLGPSAVRLLPGSRVWRVRMPAAGAGALRRLHGVAAAEPNRRRRVAAGDPLRGRQTHLRQIRWTAAGGGRPPLVAVLDTGVDARHPDLRGVVDARTSTSFTGASALQDPAGHGTHVAGIIAAVPGNGIGGAGVARARIMSVRIADSAGDADTASLVRGIRWAVSRRARVINISLGGEGFSPLERDAIADACRAGVLVVVAAGNSGRAGGVEYPGAYRHVVAVGAVRRNGLPLVDSTRGPQVAIAAPGGLVWSTDRRGGYRARTGTSMAAAVVSGAAARLLARRPSLTATQVEDLLVATARDAGPPGRDDATGAGVVDLAAALAAPVPRRDVPEPDDDAPLARARRAPITTGVAAREIAGRVTQWSDPADAVPVELAVGERIEIAATGVGGLDPDIVVWKPGTPAPAPGVAHTARWMAASALGPGPAETLAFTAVEPGTHTVELRAAGRGGAYRLLIRRIPAPPSGP